MAIELPLIPPITQDITVDGSSFPYLVVVYTSGFLADGGTYRTDVVSVVTPPIPVVTPPAATVVLDPPPLYLSGALHARAEGAMTRFDTRSHSRS